MRRSYPSPNRLLNIATNAKVVFDTQNILSTEREVERYSFAHPVKDTTGTLALRHTGVHTAIGAESPIKAQVEAQQMAWVTTAGNDQLALNDNMSNKKLSAARGPLPSTREHTDKVGAVALTSSGQDSMRLLRRCEEVHRNRLGVANFSCLVDDASLDRHVGETVDARTCDPLDWTTLRMARHDPGLACSIQRLAPAQQTLRCARQSLVCGCWHDVLTDSMRAGTRMVCTSMICTAAKTPIILHSLWIEYVDIFPNTSERIASNKPRIVWRGPGLNNDASDAFSSLHLERRIHFVCSCILRTQPCGLLQQPPKTAT